MANPFKTPIRDDDALQNKWLSPHDPSNRGDINFEHEPSLTDQSGAKDADINNIVATYHKTGIFPGVDVDQVFSDVSDAPTYMEAKNIVARASQQFELLDAKIRKRFDNDPSQFLEFVDDPQNGPELVKMGLATLAPPTPSPAPPEPAQAPPASSNTKRKSAPPPESDES